MAEERQGFCPYPSCSLLVHTYAFTAEQRDPTFHPTLLAISWCRLGGLSLSRGGYLSAPSRSATYTGLQTMPLCFPPVKWIATSNKSALGAINHRSWGRAQLGPTLRSTQVRKRAREHTSTRAREHTSIQAQACKHANTPALSPHGLQKHVCTFCRDVSEPKCARRRSCHRRGSN